MLSGWTRCGWASLSGLPGVARLTCLPCLTCGADLPCVARLS